MSKMSGGSTAVVNTANTAPLESGMGKPLGSGPVSTQNLKVAQESKPLGSGPVVPVLTEKWILPDKQVGDAPFELVTPKSNSNGKISYTNGNDEVATVTPDGHVEIKNAGTTTIVAHQEADGVYGEAKFKIPLLVFQADPTIDPWVLPDKKVGDAPFELVPPKSNSDGKISYTGDNAEVATVPPDGSAVVIKGAGTTTIVAHQEATDNYSEGTMEGKLTVAAADPNEVAAIQVQDAPQDAPQGAPQGEATVNQNATYDDGTMVPIGERCEFVRIDPKKHESIKSHKGPFESGKLLKNSSWLTGDGDDRFFYPECEVQLDNGEMVKSDFNSSPNVMMPKLLFKVMPKPIDDVFAAPAPAPAIAVAPAAVAPAAVTVAAADEANEESDAKRRKLNDDDCFEEGSIFSNVNPGCVQPKKVALETLMKNAQLIPRQWTNDAVAEGIVDILKTTKNEKIADILTKEALSELTGKDAEFLNKVITDPRVAEKFDKFTNNLSGVVGNSLEQLGDDIQKPLNEAVDTATEGLISTATHAAANAPGAGALVTMAEAVRTVNKLKDEAAEVMGAVENAKLPIDAAMKDIVPLSAAIDKVAAEVENSQAAAAGAVAGATSGVASGVAGATNVVASGAAEVNDAAASGVAEVNNAIPKDPETIGKKRERGREGGGSRKRRRIHKLSRRIERTLRRVQKKHGLRDDKNSFLRRTLRRGYVKP